MNMSVPIRKKPTIDAKIIISFLITITFLQKAAAKVTKRKENCKT